jgi:hypothetical protein
MMLVVGLLLNLLLSFRHFDDFEVCDESSNAFKNTHFILLKLDLRLG